MCQLSPATIPSQIRNVFWTQGCVIGMRGAAGVHLEQDLQGVVDALVGQGVEKALNVVARGAHVVAGRDELLR